jgi:hypothetical protein
MGAGAKLKEFDVDNQYGAEALKQLYHELGKQSLPMPALQQPVLPGGVSFSEHMMKVRVCVRAYPLLLSRGTTGFTGRAPLPLKRSCHLCSRPIYKSTGHRSSTYSYKRVGTRREAKEYHRVYPSRSYLLCQR